MVRAGLALNDEGITKFEALNHLCHSERSRGISSFFVLQLIRDVSTTLDMTKWLREGGRWWRHDEARM